MSSNLQFFQGRAVEAESTVLPALTGWLSETLNDFDPCPIQRWPLANKSLKIWLKLNKLIIMISSHDRLLMGDGMYTTYYLMFFSDADTLSIFTDT